MTDTEFETRVKTLVNADVDNRLGPPRPAPPFAERLVAPRSRVLAPLLAAACIAVLAGAVAVGAHLHADRHGAAPGDPPHNPPSQSARPLAGLGGAEIGLPIGWSFRVDTAAANRWCLTAQLPAVGQRPGPCHLTLTRIAAAGPNIDVDAQSGYYSDPPQYCAPDQPRQTEATARRTFGGRSAEWRRWVITCPGGTVHQLEQYVVATGPGYILYSDRSDATIHAAMTEIAQWSVLPPPSAPLRYTDRGVLTSVVPTASGVRFQLRRTIRTRGTAAPGDGAGEAAVTTDYVVPSAVFERAGSPPVGTQIYLATNGRTVRTVEREG